jgi:hypothetical protein
VHVLDDVLLSEFAKHGDLVILILHFVELFVSQLALAVAPDQQFLLAHFLFQSLLPRR